MHCVAAVSSPPSGRPTRNRRILNPSASNSASSYSTSLTVKAIERKEKHISGDVAAGDDGGEVIYKIEVAANRYDLLCLEGIARALRIFDGSNEVIDYKVTKPSYMLEMHVKPEIATIRPFVVCAVLRGVTFDEARIKSFMDLQDKIHQNLCQRRTFVAIVTHDLDTLQGPFSYEVEDMGRINYGKYIYDRKSRGSTRDDTGVHDSIVNQLLMKIDGVESLNNVLLIGMTNQKDLLDEALLRPGRLEVHVEINLPDESGRLQILEIHTNKMKENSFLDKSVDLKKLRTCCTDNSSENMHEEGT